MKGFGWIDAVHYGSSGLLLLLAGLSTVGVDLPGVTVDAKVAGAAGVAALVAGMKSGVTSGSK